jgi:hypothetical protein
VANDLPAPIEPLALGSSDLELIDPDQVASESGGLVAFDVASILADTTAVDDATLARIRAALDVPGLGEAGPHS